MQLFCFKQFGVVTGFEAGKYISQAESLRTTGHYTSENFIFYSVESVLILFSKISGSFPWLVVLLQLLTNAVSTVLFYRLVFLFTKRAAVAFAATFFFICMFYYQAYNVYLFTESLFFSFSVFFSYYLFTVNRLSFLVIVVALSCLLVLILTRPTGVLFLPPTVFFFIFRFGKKKAWLFFCLSFTLGLIVFYFLLNAALNSGGEFDFLLPYIEEHVICGVPGVQQAHNISMPVNKNSVEGLWYVIQHNRSLFFRLATDRFLTFWGVQRTYFSKGHNIFVAVYFYGLYVAVIFGFRKMCRYALPQTIFMSTYIFLVMLTVLLSCDEWHNRFLYSLLPFLLIMATGPFIKKPVNVASTGFAS